MTPRTRRRLSAHVLKRALPDAAGPFFIFIAQKFAGAGRLAAFGAVGQVRAGKLQWA
jgi:hypothetical protein